MINNDKTLDTLIALLENGDTPLHTKRYIRESIITFLSINNSTFEYAWEKSSDTKRPNPFGNARERQQTETTGGTEL